MTFFDSIIQRVLRPLNRASYFSPKEIRKLSAPAQSIVQAAWKGMESDRLCDYHFHVIGTDTSSTKNFINEKFLSWKHLILHIRYLAFLDGFKIQHATHAEADVEEYILQLINSIPKHGKFGLLAFDKFYNDEGVMDYDKTTIYVSNEYVFGLANKYPDLFFPIMSIHPYRKDAIERLHYWDSQGGKIIKWLPNAMGMNPNDVRCTLYYETMRQLNLTLLSHTGKEFAIPVASENQKLGNPLLFRKPLEQGVKVIMAHCSTAGSDIDLDHPSHRKVSNFDLFLRMMKDPQYKGLLYGDISGVTLINHISHLSTLLEETQPGGVLDGRLINGSDFPLPVFNCFISTKALWMAGYLSWEEQKCLTEIYQYNPLLFDIVLKRTIHHPRTGKQFPPSLFLNHLIQTK